MTTTNNSDRFVRPLQHLPPSSISFASDKLRYSSALKTRLEDYEDVVVSFWNDVLLFKSPRAAAAVYGGVGAILWIIVHSNLPLVSFLALSFASYTVVTEAVLLPWENEVDETPNIYHPRTRRARRPLQWNRTIAPLQSLDAIVDTLADMSVTVMRGLGSVKTWKERNPDLYVPATCCLALQITVLGTRVSGYVFMGMLVYSALLVPAIRFYGLFEQFYHFAAMWMENQARRDPFQPDHTTNCISRSTSYVLPSTYPSSPQLVSSMSPLIIDGDNIELQMVETLDLATTEPNLSMVLNDEQESDSANQQQVDSKAAILQEEAQYGMGDLVARKERASLSDSEPRLDDLEEAGTFDAGDVDERVVTEVPERAAVEITNPEIKSHDQLVLSLVNDSPAESETEIPTIMATIDDVDIYRESTLESGQVYGQLQRDEEKEEKDQHMQVEADYDHDSDWEKDFNLSSLSASLGAPSSSLTSAANLTNDVVSKLGFVRSVGRKLGVSSRTMKIQHGNEYVDDDNFGKEMISGADESVTALEIANNTDERQAM